MEIKFWKFVSLTLIALFNVGLVNAQCGPEAARCSTCESDGTSCASCFMGFQLDVSATPRVCIQCGTNCLRCNRTDTPCTLCRVENGPDSANIGQCGPCDTDQHCLGVCAKNGAGKCDRCKEGYGVGTQKLCEPCPPNCLQCSANGTAICDICAPGYTVNSANGQCDQCAPNCVKCEKGGECDECEPGYALNELRTCDPAPSGATGPNSGGSTTPGGGGGNTTPGGGSGGNTTPGGGGSGSTTSGGGGGNTTPGGGGGNTSPGGGGGGNTTPVGGGGDGNTTPEGGEGGNNGEGNGGMDGLSGGRLIALILGVIGGLLLLLFTLIACWYCWRPNACAWREDDEDVSYVVKRYQRQHVCSHECSPCDDPEPVFHNHPWKVKVRKTTILV